MYSDENTSISILSTQNVDLINNNIHFLKFVVPTFENAFVIHCYLSKPCKSAYVGISMNKRPRLEKILAQWKIAN